MNNNTARVLIGYLPAMTQERAHYIFKERRSCLAALKADSGPWGEAGTKFLRLYVSAMTLE